MLDVTIQLSHGMGQVRGELAIKPLDPEHYNVEIHLSNAILDGRPIHVKRPWGTMVLNPRYIVWAGAGSGE